MPTALATCSAAPVSERLRTVQSMTAAPNVIVPAFNIRCRRTLRLFVIIHNLGQSVPALLELAENHHRLRFCDSLSGINDLEERVEHQRATCIEIHFVNSMRGFESSSRLQRYTRNFLIRLAPEVAIKVFPPVIA